MIQIQSTWFPLTDRNPQVFLNIPDAKPSDFVKATQRIYHAPSQFSSIETNILPTPPTKN
jgi:predicted acyl esterase